MDENKILEILQMYIQEEMSKNDGSHDWWHVRRVYNNAMLINEKEKGNPFVVGVTSLLHDIYDHKYSNGSIKSNLTKLLVKLDLYRFFKVEDIQNILNSCENIGFSSNLEGKKELSKEGKIVQDADRLDAIGAIGIARVFTYGGKKGKAIYNPDEENNIITKKEYIKNGSNTSISHFYDKLLKIKQLMNTDTAIKIAEHRQKYMEEFLEEFYEEWNGRR